MKALNIITMFILATSNRSQLVLNSSCSINCPKINWMYSIKGSNYVNCEVSFTRSSENFKSLDAHHPCIVCLICLKLEYAAMLVETLFFDQDRCSPSTPITASSLSSSLSIPRHENILVALQNTLSRPHYMILDSTDLIFIEFCRFQ